MTPPRWDGDFPEYRPRRPGPGVRRAKGRRPFGESWWGSAWVDALEHGARLDPNRLPRGRTYARTGAVGDLTLAAGLVSAPVQGSRSTPYRVSIRVAQFSAPEWERVLDALAAEIGHVAALVDGELSPSVADDVRSTGLDLLPGPGELQCRCSCPDWAEPCKHAAAVCYLVADSLDEDPFGVLLLRGRSRDEVLAALRARRAAGSGSPGAGAGDERLATSRDLVDEGVVARVAWARAAEPDALTSRPVLAELPRRAGRPTVLAADPPPGLGVDLSALRALAADAAERALALVRGASKSGLELDFRTDLARRAAALIGQGSEHGDGVALGAADQLPALARRSGMAARELLWRAVAYREGGLAGLAALDEIWDPGAAVMAAGAGMLGSGAVVRRNRVTLGPRQLRLGRDGRWYPFRKGRVSDWIPDGGPVEPLPSAGPEVGELE